MDAEARGLFSGLADTLGIGGKKKTPRPKIITPVSLPTTPQAETQPNQEKNTMTSSISYNPGTGKADKAFFKLGKTSVPVAVISRIGRAIEGLTPTKASFIIYNKLAPKHGAFIEEMDKAEMDYYDATLAMLGMRPVRVPSTGRTSKTKTLRAAEIFGKAICKRFKGTPEEMLNAFLQVVNKEEFKTEALDVIKAFEKNFKRNTMGYIKTNDRKGNPAAIKALKDRAAKKKAKK